MTTCPKCQYTRGQHDAHLHPDTCPRCGIVYRRWIERQAAALAPKEDEAEEEAPTQTFLDWLTEPPERVDGLAFWARALCAAGLVLWSLYFFGHGVDWEAIGGSFLHNVNLAFHEFGHLFFRPLGEFMTILGGSLFQVLFPWVFVWAFLFKHRDTYAASLMLWWAGQNFIDLSPYIGDAYYRGLPLVGGASEDAHDWGNLLTMTGLLEQYQSIARLSFGIGAVMMCIALAWTGRCLWRQWRQLQYETT